MALKEVFTAIYETNKWGSAESRSGTGSEVANTAYLRRELPLLLQRLNVRTLLDIPCGDFNWMKEIPLEGIAYHGADIVDALVADNNRRYGAPDRKFSVLDITCDPLPACDLILCKDAMSHLPNTEIVKALDNIKNSGSRYLLMTHNSWWGAGENMDIVPGQWRRINFEKIPFNLPAPQTMLIQGVGAKGCEDRVLALWEISAL